MRDLAKIAIATLLFPVSLAADCLAGSFQDEIALLQRTVSPRARHTRGPTRLYGGKDSDPAYADAKAHVTKLQAIQTNASPSAVAVAVSIPKSLPKLLPDAAHRATPSKGVGMDLLKRLEDEGLYKEKLKPGESLTDSLRVNNAGQHKDVELSLSKSRAVKAGDKSRSISQTPKAVPKGLAGDEDLLNNSFKGLLKEQLESSLTRAPKAAPKALAGNVDLLNNSFKDLLKAQLESSLKRQWNTLNGQKTDQQQVVSSPVTKSEWRQVKNEILGGVKTEDSLPKQRLESETNGGNEDEQLEEVQGHVAKLQAMSVINSSVMATVASMPDILPTAVLSGGSQAANTTNPRSVAPVSSMPQVLSEASLSGGGEATNVSHSSNVAPVSSIPEVLPKASPSVGSLPNSTDSTNVTTVSSNPGASLKASPNGGNQAMTVANSSNVAPVSPASEGVPNTFATGRSHAMGVTNSSNLPPVSSAPVVSPKASPSGESLRNVTNPRKLAPVYSTPVVSSKALPSGGSLQSTTTLGNVAPVTSKPAVSPQASPRGGSLQNGTTSSNGAPVSSTPRVLPQALPSGGSLQASSTKDEDLGGNGTNSEAKLEEDVRAMKDEARSESVANQTAQREEVELEKKLQATKAKAAFINNRTALAASLRKTDLSSQVGELSNEIHALRNELEEERKGLKVEVSEDPRKIADHVAKLQKVMEHDEAINNNQTVNGNEAKLQEQIAVAFHHHQTMGLSFDNATGVVHTVSPGSQADQAGVKIGWTMVKVEGDDYSHDGLVGRATGNNDFIVTFDTKAPLGYVQFHHHHRMGLTFDNASGVINEVSPGSQADHAGVKTGWIMAKLDGDDYSHDRLQARALGNADFTVVFNTEDSVAFRDTEGDRILFVRNPPHKLDYFVNGLLKVTNLTKLATRAGVIRLDGTSVGNWTAARTTVVPHGKEHMASQALELFHKARTVLKSMPLAGANPSFNPLKTLKSVGSKAWGGAKSLGSKVLRGAKSVGSKALAGAKSLGSAVWNGGYAPYMGYGYGYNPFGSTSSFSPGELPPQWAPIAAEITKRVKRHDPNFMQPVTDEQNRLQRNLNRLYHNLYSGKPSMPWFGWR